MFKIIELFNHILNFDKVLNFVKVFLILQHVRR